MLNINNISKSFIQRGLVLDNLCLEVNEGETLAIMGPSGFREDYTYEYYWSVR